MPSVEGRDPQGAAELGDYLLEAVGLSVGYGSVPVVHQLDLVVKPGEVVALLGANGAGKTTTLLGLSGALPPLEGEVRWHGDRHRLSLHKRCRDDLSFVPEGRGVLMGLSTLQNLQISRGDPQLALKLFPELVGRLHTKAGLLSGGEQQMLALGRALSRKPKLLFADELSLGLAPMAISRLLDAVKAAAQTGIGVLLVEQHVQRALTVADRAYVLQRGRLALSGPADEVARRLDEVEASYLS